MSKAKYLAFYENWRMNKKWCTPEEWYELEDLILQLRFDGIDTKVENIKNPKLQMIWNNIRPSLLKSNRDKKYNDNKKSALQEVTSTEFDLPKIEDYNNGNIQENCQNLENENKADLSPSKPSMDAEYHQQVEMPSNGLKTGEKDSINDNIDKEEIMGNPTNIILNKETGKYYTDEKVKEIREKVEKSNNKPLPVVEDNIPLWEDYLKEISFKLKDTIDGFNSTISTNRTIQAPTNLRELLSDKAGRYYKDRIIKIIEHYTNQQIVA